MKTLFYNIFCPLMAGFILSLSSCDDDTSFIGADVMPGEDEVSTSSSEYLVQTRSVKVDSVLANTNECFLGSIIDPETRAMTTCGFLAQFHVMDNYKFPEKDRMVLDANGKVIADSCEIHISFDQYYGDSLKSMKLYVQELDTSKVLRENIPYYTNMEPMQYVNPAGLKTSMAFTVNDQTRTQTESNNAYYRSVIVRLPSEYGSYIINKYYENPQFFRNSYQFINHVCAGFYFRTMGSLGTMINVNVSTLDVYFRYHTETLTGKDTIVDGMQRMAATEEVIQNTRVENKIPEGMLEKSNPYSYVKSPTGIFTEVVLPVSEIVADEHYNDTINSARLILRRFNNFVDANYALNPPSDLLLIRKDKVTTFFEKNRLPHENDSYLTSFNPITNSYVYNNISQLVTVLKNERDLESGVLPTDSKSDREAKYAIWEKANSDWNKVLLIPVKTEYTMVSDIYGMTSKKLLQVRNAMGLNSVKLEGGNSESLKISVIYSRFEK